MKILLAYTGPGDAAAKIALLKGAELPPGTVLEQLPPGSSYAGRNGAAQKNALKYARLKAFDAVILAGTLDFSVQDVLDVAGLLAGGGCDAVLTRARHKRTGPLPARLADAVFKALQNRLLGTDIPDFHPGLKALALPFAGKLPFEFNSDTDEFDVQVLVQLLDVKARIAYAAADAGSSVGRARGALRSGLASVALSRVQKMSLWYHPRFDYTDENRMYTAKFGYESSHQFAFDAVPERASVLDLGCGPGYMAAQLSLKNISTISLDRYISEEAKACSAGTIEADVETYDFALLPGRADYVLALDIMEHLNSPEAFLKNIREKLAGRPPRVIITTANIAFIVIRLSLLAGQFNYGRKGILDMDHKRLFTFASLRELLSLNGYSVLEAKGIPAPFPVALGDTRLARFLLAVNSLLIGLSRSLFSYQIAVVARPDPLPEQIETVK